MPDAATALSILGGALNAPAPDGGSIGTAPDAPVDGLSAKLDILSQGAQGKLPPPPAPAAYPVQPGQRTGSGANLAAGANEAISGVLGAPADIVNTITAPFSAGADWLDNRARGLFGAPQLTPEQFAELHQRTRMPGGSADINSAFGTFGADPRTVAPADGIEAALRGTGAGIAGTVLPGMGARALTEGGALLAPAARIPTGSLGDTVLNAFGTGSPGNLAVVGGAGGAGGEALSQVVPEPYKPLANLAGNFAAGGPAALAYEGIPALWRSGSRIVSNYFRPFSEAGQQKLAGTTLVNASSGGKAGLLEGLKDPDAGELVPGSQPTTFQATGNLGIGGLERARSTANPEPFIARRADQNEARTGAIDRLAPETADAAAPGEFFQRQLATMDSANDARITAAQNNAGNLLNGLGGTLERNDYGGATRQALENAKAAVKKDEAAKWNAIDPNGTLAVDVSPVTKAASEIPDSMSRSAKPMEGEEKAIFDVAQSYPGVVPFKELGDLRGRVLSQIREIRPQGESPELRRLTMLRQSIDNAMADGVGQKADATAGTPSSSPAVAPDEGGLGVKAPTSGTAVFTPSGRRIDVNHEVVDLAGPQSPITSHTPDFRPNPQYPAELQPRDRSRAASELQVTDIAGNLQPERLGASGEATSGAPIIGPDNVVESGNARTLALAKAYRENTPKAAAYRQWLESQGIDTSGHAAPMLVRRRTTDLSPEERVRFAEESNGSPGLSMSSTERAAQDSGRISDAVLSQYAGGDLNSPANRGFVRSFISSVPERGEMGAFATADGQLSLEGERRIQGALLHKAYDNPGLVRALTETGDENIRAFGNGLADAAGDFAKLRGEIAAGRVEPKLDIAKSVGEAAAIVREARSKGIPLGDAVAQQDAFSKLSPITEELLKGAYGEDLSGRVSRYRLGDLLRVYAEEAGKQTTEARLFGEALQPSEILQTARTKYGNGAESTPSNGIPGSAGRVRPSNAAGGQEASGPGNGAAGTGARTAGGADQGILPEKPLTANFDEAAAARYRAAADATREKKQTFGVGAVGQVLQSGRAGSPYSVADSQVAGKFFNKGAKALEDVQSFVKAVGGNDRAVAVLKDFAANRLRDAAERADGTIDPAKLSKWLDDHHDALRAFPSLADRFRNAGAAQKAVDEMIAERARDHDLYVKGAAQHFLGTDPVIAVDRAFRSRDPGSTFGQLVAAVGGNADARAGLQAAVRDYIKQKFIGNTEAGTSGLELLKSDQVQTFFKKNRGALGWVFGEDGLASIEAVTKDLQRANRSIASSKLPGQSNTAQDLAAMDQHASKGKSIVGKAMSHGSDVVAFAILEKLGEHLGGGLAGAGAGIALFAGGKVVQALRAAGIDSVNALVERALLDPALAKALVMKVPAGSTGPATLARQRLLAALQRLAVVGTVNQPE